MQAGALDRYITIDQLPLTQDTRGEPIPGAPTTFATLWARQESFSGAAEQQLADQGQFASAVVTWLTRYIPGVLPKMRVNEGGVIYEIIGVDETKFRVGELRLQTVRLGV